MCRCALVMDSGELASMYAQIVRGMAKEDSRFVTDEESSALWDKIAASVEEATRTIPNVQFWIPNEMPDADDDDDDDPIMPATPTAPEGPAAAALRRLRAQQVNPATPPTV